MPIAKPSLSNLEDVRHLREILDNLQKRLSKLEAASIPFVANQKGPLPGFMRAVALNDANLKASMWMNFTNIGPGSGPYGAVTDATGRVRFEWGNLAAYTDPGGVASAATLGQRTIAADGTLISDSVGNPNLIKILVNIIDTGGGTIGPGVTGNQVVKSLAYTVPNRNLPIFAIGLLNGYVSDSGGILALAANALVTADSITGGPPGEVPIFVNSGAGNPGSVTSFQAIVKAPGTYTAQLLWNALANTQTLHWQSASLVVLQLGS